MGYGRGDRFPFDYKLNGIPFGSKSKGKLSPRPYPIQCERKWNTSFLSVARETNRSRQDKSATIRMMHDQHHAYGLGALPSNSLFTRWNKRSQRI